MLLCLQDDADEADRLPYSAAGKVLSPTFLVFSFSTGDAVSLSGWDFLKADLFPATFFSCLVVGVCTPILPLTKVLKWSFVAYLGLR